MARSFLIRSVVIAGITLCAGFTVNAQDDSRLTLREFRDTVIEAVQTRSDDAVCVARLTDGGFRSGPSTDNCEFYSYLDAAYAEYSVAPETLPDIVSRHADTVVTVMTAGIDETDFNERLVVQLRPASFLSQADEDTMPVTRRFAGDLIAVLMLDSKTSIATVSTRQLSAHGLTEEKAFAMAAANLRDRMGEVYVDEYRHINMLSSSNGLISGQIWLPETCSETASDAVYFVYDHNGLMRVNMADMVGVSNLLSVANGMVLQGSSLASSVVSCKSGNWSQLWPSRTASISDAHKSVYPG